jgi:hypothetical protein
MADLFTQIRFLYTQFEQLCECRIRSEDCLGRYRDKYDIISRNIHDDSIITELNRCAFENETMRIVTIECVEQHIHGLRELEPAINDAVKELNKLLDRAKVTNRAWDLSFIMLS